VKVGEAYSTNELYQKVSEYDIVFTSEAAMMSALNDRLEEPVLGHFAVTPMIYTFSKFQNQKLLQERGIFIELVKNTDLLWKQSSYLLDNVLDCWKNEGSLDSIKQYDEFNTDSVQKVIDVIESTDNVFSKMQEVEVGSSKDVAVVNFENFNEIDKQVLPEDFDKFEILKDEKKELPRFKVYNSGTEIVRTVVENVEQETAQDIAVVLNQESSYSTLVESALESKGIPVMRQESLKEDEGLRTLIKILRLGVNSDRKLVKDCQPVLSQLDIDIPIEKNNDYLSEVDGDEIEEFKDLLEEIKNSKVNEVLEKLDSYIETELEEDFRDLGILDRRVSEEVVNKLEYYLDTYNVEKDSAGTGVLLANSNSSAVVDRPIVFYLGMDSSWTPGIPNKPWIDRKEEDERNLKEFKILIQNGEQQHYLVQDKLMNEDVTPSLYFNELTSKEFESFRDLPNERFQNSSETSAKAFEHQEYDVEVDEVELFSQSSLNTFVKSPKEYLFDRLTDSPDQEYFRKGTLYHDYAEFYANHPELIEEKGREKFIEMILEEMNSIVDELQMEVLETEFEIGLKNIEQFVDQKIQEKTGLENYSQEEDKKNFFAEKMDKEITEQFTEAWFQNKDLGVKGIADLILNENHLADYKSGKRKTASKVVSNSNLELLEDDPNFQAILYLLHLREVKNNQKLKFTFFHFLDNIEDEISGQAELEDNIVTITYYPSTFNSFIQEKEVFEYIIEGVAESNNRRKTLEKLGYSKYRNFFSNRKVENQYDKDAIQESELAEEFIRFAKAEVGDYKYVEKGCKDALKQIVYLRKENYFKEDLDAFEEFLDTQIDLINEYRENGFPVQNPEIEEVDAEELEKRDMIPE
jgi:hypothetical protein